MLVGAQRMRQISNSLAVRHSGRARSWCLPALAIALLGAISVLLGEERARAEPELDLSWSTKGPFAGCPDRAWAMARIESAIQGAPRANVPVGVKAIVEIEKRGSGFLLSLRTAIGDAHGERTIEGADCSQLAEAAVLVVVLSLEHADQESALRNSAPQTDAGAPTREPRTPDAAPPRAQPARLGFALRPELVAELGLADYRRPTLGPGLAFGLSWGRYRAELSGLWLLGEARARELDVALQLFAGQVRGCALFGAGRVRGGPCLGLELGAARARRAAANVDKRTFWAATTLALRLAVALGYRLSLVLDGGAALSWGQLRLERATDAGRETIHESRIAQFRTHLGLEIGF